MSPEYVQERTRQVAYHEAGHVVAIIVFGVETIGRVYIEEEDDICGQTFSLKPSTDSVSPEEALRIVACLMVSTFAGPAAERLFFTTLSREDHCESDYSRARSLPEEHNTLPPGSRQVGDQKYDEFVAITSSKADLLVREQQEAISSLAEALLLRRELNSKEIEECVRPHLVGARIVPL